MRRFVDLHLCPSMSNLSQMEEIIEQSFNLGYRHVGIPLPHRIRQEEIQRLRAFCDDVGVDLVTRIDLVPKTTRELLRNLRSLRRRFEIISVTCKSKSVARQAARDRRVDLLAFSGELRRKRFFDHAEAELASETGAALEIDMSSLLSLTGFLRVRLLSVLRKECAIATKSQVPIVLSSGANNVSLLREPYAYAALAMLADIPGPLAQRALSENPLRIIERNRKKLHPGYVAPGLFATRDVTRCSDE